MADIQILPLCNEHHDAWRVLWTGYLDFYQAELADGVWETTWQRLLDPAEPMHAALAWRDGEALGLVHFIYHRSCWTVQDYCYLQDLYVADAQRGSGLGRALIEYVYARAQADGAGRVHWLTQEGNARARLLYERIAERSGFIQYRKIF